MRGTTLTSNPLDFTPIATITIPTNDTAGGSAQVTYQVTDDSNRGVASAIVTYQGINNFGTGGHITGNTGDVAPGYPVLSVAGAGFDDADASPWPLDFRIRNISTGVVQLEVRAGHVHNFAIPNDGPTVGPNFTPTSGVILWDIEELNSNAVVAGL